MSVRSLASKETGDGFIDSHGSTSVLSHLRMDQKPKASAPPRAPIGTEAQNSALRRSYWPHLMAFLGDLTAVAVC